MPLPATPRKRCGAKTRSGGTCQQWAMPNGRCRMHNGGARAGIASATYKHGRYSKALPTRFRETYERAIADPDLLELRSGVAVLDSLLEEALAKLETGDSIRFLDELRKRWLELKRAVGNTQPQVDRRKALMIEIGDMIEAGGQYGDAFRAIQGLIVDRAKLSRAEAQRQKDMQTLVTAEQAMSFVSALAASVREHVTDPVALAAIQADITRALTRETE